MTYQVDTRLFLENGPAATAAAARARRASTAAVAVSEQARLEAARTVTGAELCLAA